MLRQIGRVAVLLLGAAAGGWGAVACGAGGGNANAGGGSGTEPEVKVIPCKDKTVTSMGSTGTIKVAEAKFPGRSAEQLATAHAVGRPIDTTIIGLLGSAYTGHTVAMFVGDESLLVRCDSASDELASVTFVVP